MHSGLILKYLKMMSYVFRNFLSKEIDGVTLDYLLKIISETTVSIFVDKQYFLLQ